MSLSQLNSNKFDGFQLGGGEDDIQISNPRRDTILVAQDGTGDYDNIQDAVNEAGGYIRIKEGIYVLKSTITISKSNIKIQGAGKNTILRTTSRHIIQLSGTHNNLEICDLQIEITDGDETLFGIYSLNNNFDSIKISNVYFHYCCGIFIANGCDDLSITNCTQDAEDESGQDFFVDITSCNNFVIDNNITEGEITLTTCARGNVNGNVIYGANNGDAQIYLYENNYTNINGNVCYDGVIGIKLTNNSNYNTVVGNNCYSNSSIGINVNGATCDKNIVLGNVSISNVTNITYTGTGTIKEHNIES
jgi:nitrous oxidase accessory protein NosD